MAIVTLGIDIAKNVFAFHGVNEAGKPALLKPQVPRAKLLELIAALPPCTIGLEACGGAHHWARQFQRYGQTVRLIAPKFVAPYRLSRAVDSSAPGSDWCPGSTAPAAKPDSDASPKPVLAPVGN